jgi:flagellin
MQLIHTNSILQLKIHRIKINTISTNITSLTAYNALKIQNAATANIMTELASGSLTLHKGAGSSSYVRAANSMNMVHSLGATLDGINSAISLVRSVDVAANNILDKLGHMMQLSMTVQDTQDRGWFGDQGFVCRAMFQAQESIKDIALRFNFNGQNFMIGGGENNHTTTVRNVQVRTGETAADTFNMVFKSFNPRSAVDTNGQYAAPRAAPNLPNLNATAGTDTHAYGDAAMYYGQSDGRYLHTDTPAITDHTMLQLDRAIDGVVAERSRLAAYINRLESAAETALSAKHQVKNTASRLMDTNYATKAAALAKSQILQEASTAMLAQANRFPAGVLDLIQ